MIATAATLAGARPLYVVAGLSAFLAILANVVEIVLGFGAEIVPYGAKPAAEWFDVFPRSPLDGLYALGILNIVYMLGMLPVYVGLLVVHRHTYSVSAGFALLLSVLTFRATDVAGNSAEALGSGSVVRTINARRSRLGRCSADDVGKFSRHQGEFFASARVCIGLVTERQEDLVSIRTWWRQASSVRLSIGRFHWPKQRRRIDMRRAGPSKAPWSMCLGLGQPPETKGAAYRRLGGRAMRQGGHP